MAAIIRRLSSARALLNWLKTVDGSGSGLDADTVDGWEATDLIASGFISGLTLSNNAADATNDIDIAAGFTTNTAGLKTMRLASGITKRLDAAWSVGSGNGGLDTGSIANTTYHVWLIKRSDTGVVDVLFSASATSPTVPSDYDARRRIGSIIRESGAIVQFIQDGDIFMRRTPVLSIDANNPGTSAVTRALSVPTGIRVRAIVTAQVRDVSCAANWNAIISDLSAADVAASFSTGHLTLPYNGGGSSAIHDTLEVFTDTSGQVRSRLEFSDADVYLRMIVRGWVDTRGRG